MAYLNRRGKLGGTLIWEKLSSRKGKKGKREEGRGKREEG